MWKRRHLTPQQNAENITINPDLGLRHAVLREPSIVDEFYMEKSVCPDDGKESYSCVDPIIMLFNQDRLNQLGPTAAKQFLDSLAPKSNSLSELRSKCSDDDLMKMVKSRHLQSPAEILAWCRYMEQNVDEFNAEIKRLVDEKKAEEIVVEQQQQVTNQQSE